ncbi:CotH kinase family protein [Sanyastnella coralliicola]|uniref:CotH kinase family protein n=1 Tax=Sanyastnella coralliicola TaxID=3069118 RepID=UPI0027BA8711|nr:CotH kinase family protein [Longitalea sp. SCSIO 12813]
MRVLTWISVFIFALASTSSAQVVMNEFSFANYDDLNVDPGGWDGEFEDWVEFYNPTGADVDISGYYMTDQADNLDKFEIPAGTIVPANGRLLVLITNDFDEDPYMWGWLNTNFKVNQTQGESIIFSDPGLTPIDSFTFGTDIDPNQRNHSYGRSTDGAADWVIFTNASPEDPNGGPSGTSYAAAPVIDMEAGYYAGGTTLTISSEPNTTVYYTTDGSEPTDGSAMYTGPIDINATTVVKAIAYHDNDTNVLPSLVETNSYFTGDDQHSIVVCSVSGPTLSDGAWNGDELMALEFFYPGGGFWCEGLGDSNEHGNDSNAYGQRGFDYVGRDQLGYNHEIEEELFHEKDRDHYQRLIFKAAANDNYPFEPGAHIRDAYVHTLSHKADLDMDERTSESCIVYINGEYWGVYEYREKIDDLDFTDEYYDQPRHFVDFLKTWGGTWEEYGSIDDWNTLVNFVTTQDMTDPANYEYVESVYNTGSLIDYFILNSYIVSADWLNWNTAWWRGRHPDGGAKKWRYILWDMDASFGHYVNYTGVPDTGPEADPCNPEVLGDPGGQGHVPILNALLENEDFYADYINRWADLSNSYLNCDYMHYLLDSMVNEIEPEMQRQCDRWGGNIAGWETELQQLRDFIDTRCEQTVVDGMEDCYDVEAITITIIIEGIGEVEIETFDIGPDMVPWEGIYFAGFPINLDAEDEGLGVFLYWEVLEGDLVIADPENPSIIIEPTGDVTIVAYFLNDLDPQNVMFDVQPEGAGDILFGGVPMGPYPNTQLVDGGPSSISAVGADQWFVFDHWETINANVNPDEFSADGTTFIATTDTIVAVFNELPHFDINVAVEPAGAGWITMDGTELDSYPWTGTVAGEVDIAFATAGYDEWSVFDHWEVNNTPINPDEFAQNITLNFTTTDTIVAVYNVIPHNTITILVEPAEAGLVIVDNTLTVNESWSGELEAETPTPFAAFPEAFWYFDRWESVNHLPTPDNRSSVVDFEFYNSDTIVAHFVEEPFNVYVPNSFTPNNDGKNDVFLPVGSAWKDGTYELWVFNRWGDVVFYSDDPTKPWNGSHQDGTHYVADQIYVYRLTVQPVHSVEPEEFSGHITVFR